MEQSNLTVRNLESRNSALESQCIQLEHQNIQVVEDRKELNKRLEETEELYQKTLQEKMQLEKDLQYNVNQQLLSHKVMYRLYIHAFYCIIKFATSHNKLYIV